MLGAIIGDIVGSRFEFDNIKTKDFEFFHPQCSVTDDSVLTAAVAKAILERCNDADHLSQLTVKYMQEIGGSYPECLYGGMFRKWLKADDPQPYNSFGNGAAMRVSPCGFAAESLQQAIDLSRAVTRVTHNHPEGIKGAEATAVAIYLAKIGSTIPQIRRCIHEYYYPLNFTLDEIREAYSFNESCQQTVPQAIEAFLESTSFEDAIRNAVSIGGDSDTLAAITGSIAEAYYGVPAEIKKQAMSYIPEPLADILFKFQETFQSHNR